MRFYLKYFIDLGKFNLLLSCLGGWFGLSLELHFATFFLLSYCTVGFLGSVYLYHYFHANEYFLYHNRGISKSALNVRVEVANILLCLLLISPLHKSGWL